MKFVIFEDEDPTVLRFEIMIWEIDPGAERIQHLMSINSAVGHLKNAPHPDVIFMDIQLGDGNSFEIFDIVVPDCPIIFIIAFDKYAIQTFKVNSIDNLLKPVKKVELAAALNKLYKMAIKNLAAPVDYHQLMQLIKMKSDLQKRILICYSDTIKSVEINEVAYFYTENKINFLCKYDNRNLPIDQNLDQIETIADTAVFFRINRLFTVNIKSITKILSYGKSSCAKIGRPQASSAQERVILDSYANVSTTGEVTPFDLGDSEIKNWVIKGS